MRERGIVSRIPSILWQSARAGGGFAKSFLPLFAVGLTAAVCSWMVRWPAPFVPAACAQEAGDEDEEDSDDDKGVYLPVDRGIERRLATARRLIAESRWSDAAALLDELVVGDRDSFFKRDADTATWQSVKVEAGRLIGGMPPEGRAAYELQFRARADRMLREAISTGDRQAVADVARRWLNTPAGQRAALIVGLEALDNRQPLTAAAWLDRLHAAGARHFEPMLSVMRAVAWQRAGDEVRASAILDAARSRNGAAMRIAGHDVSVSFAAGKGLDWLSETVGAPPAGATRAAADWCMHRGDPGRNGLSDASRPLLVPRYRVPLTRHPQEAKWLEDHRGRGADRDAPLVPAAVPLAVNGTIVVHTPMGLLAVDFETGKRRWLQAGGASAAVIDTADVVPDDGPMTSVDRALQRTLAPVFDDSTSGTLASDGRLVFAVESHPDAIIARDGFEQQLRMGETVVGNWTGGNTLAAYDLSDGGRLRWRLPATSAGRQGETPAWKLGSPLPVGDRLFLLVEELGEVRLDVLDAKTGSTLWSQPLVELDEQNRVDNRDNQPRRVAGLSPALAEGVLVCPTGAGAVVAVDLATRTLLWAYHYRVGVPSDGGAFNNDRIRLVLPGRIVGGRMGGRPAAEGPDARHRWIDSCPVLSDGRAILTPGEADEMHCVDLREGTILWKRPRNDGMYVAGVTAKRILIVGRRSVEAVSIENGQTTWSTALSADGGTVSGRALVAADRLFVPLDTPEIVEIEVGSGAVVGRSPGRGGAVPGNLVSYRGELLSQSADSLDVFHQVAPLKTRIEAARSDAPSIGDHVWTLTWRGHLRIDQGAVVEGIADLLAAQATSPDRLPPDMLAEAMVFAMERDESVAKALWSDLDKLQPNGEILGRGMRVAIDGMLHSGDFTSAWSACRRLLELPDCDSTAADQLVPDGREPRLRLTHSRWLQSRVTDLYVRGPAEVRSAIDAFASASLHAIREGTSSSGARVTALVSFIERLGRHPVAIDARRQLIDCLGGGIAADRTDVDAARSMALKRDFVLLDLLHAGTAVDRGSSATALAAAKADFGAGGADAVDEAWPRGRVAARLRNSAHRDAAQGSWVRTFPLHVEDGGQAILPGLRFAFDMQQGAVVVSDGLGRRFGGPLTSERTHPLGTVGFNPSVTDVTVIGRVAIIRSGGFVVAYELADEVATGLGGGHRRLWSAGGTFTQPRPGFLGQNDRRFPRIGSVPLGEPIHEQDVGGPVARIAGLPDSPARVSGVPMLVDDGLQVRDALTGALVWERRRLPEAGSVFGDDDVLCVCPASGRGAKVFSMATGHLIRTVDLPERGQRLLTHGRAVVAVTCDETAAAGRNVAKTVGIEIIDPRDMRRWQLGEFSGESRATMAGSELAILEPSGRLTLINLADRRVEFTADLPDMPKRLQRLDVMAWRDRLIVIAGRAETDEEGRQIDGSCMVSALPQMTAAGNPITGSIWAVDRHSGQMLWPGPATILRHCLDPDQPSDLPVLLFARQIEIPREGGRPRLSVLCLDKRTGHAVYADDKILAQPQRLFGCDAVGDPDRHRISILPLGDGMMTIDLDFTGEPLALDHPFRASSGPPLSGDIGKDLKYLLDRMLPFQFPF